jgi:hypothetical protein
MIEAPKLLVEWSSPWQEFVSSIGPALGKSPARLAGEAQTGLFPIRGMLLSWGVQAVFIAALIWIPAKLFSMRPYVAHTPPKYEVIYFSADELPQVADRGGAQAGQSGRAGGQEAFHHTQTIRVNRGSGATAKVVDAPDLKLPISADPVKNLLAFKPVPGPPPAEGIQRSVAAPSLSKNAIVAPPPAVMRELDRDIPRLGSSVIAPPPASLSADKMRQTMGLTPVIIEPAAKDVPRDQSRSLVAMNSPVIQAAPDVQRQPPPLRGPSGAITMVVPPPVSAPLRDAPQNPKLAMPAATVIAPPPSQVDREQRTVSGVALADPKVVPPPVQLGSRSQDRQAIIGPSGADRIVPPPPSVAGGSAISGGGRGQSNKAGGFGTTMADNIVPPPPNLSGDGSRTGAARGGDPRGSMGGIPGATAIVPPPPSVGSVNSPLSGKGSGLGSPTVVPPPPSMKAGSGSLTGRGMGTKGGGIGGAFDNGSALTPPTSAGGSTSGKGVVVSTQPGSREGLPGNGSPGSLAMSPSGSSKAGLGGSGGGEGIGHGNGPGSGLAGEGSGAAKAGTGRGSDPNAHGGTSPYPGTGGAGSGSNGQPAMPGVSSQGGSTGIVTLPSFGSNETEPTIPGRSSAGDGRNDFDYTIEGTSRSGGGFNLYGLLRGDKVYTKHVRTVDGLVVMQFSDSSSASHTYGVELTPPAPLHTDLPANATKHARIIIACILDRSGSLKNLQVLKSDPGAGTSRVLAALSSWKFSPAQRGAEPIEVNAILGFNIGTGN